MENSKMRNQTYLLKRGGVFYFRIKIPTDLVLIFRPKHEIKFSLHTRDKKRAMQIAHLEAVRHDQMFAEARAKAYPNDDEPLQIIHHLDEETIRALCLKLEVGMAKATRKAILNNPPTEADCLPAPLSNATPWYLKSADGWVRAPRPYRPLGGQPSRSAMDPTPVYRVQ